MQRNKFYPEGRLLNQEKNRLACSNPPALREAMERQTILEATALSCDAEHNLTVRLGDMRGIIPREEGALGIKEGRVRDIAIISRVGKAVCFTVTDLTRDEKGRQVALLSRRRAQQLCRQNYLDTLAAGSVVRAVVTHMEGFGAFCDIGCGVVALLPIDAISVSRIAHPSDRFSVGDEIRAVIKQREADGKITLTHKELLGTFEENLADFSEGQTVTGIIRSVEGYGAFVELAPNLAGLAELCDGLRVGMQAVVYIKSIIPEKMKLKLIIIDTLPPKTEKGVRYFFKGERLELWQYSPKGCHKNLFTDFNR